MFMSELDFINSTCLSLSIIDFPYFKSTVFFKSLMRYYCFLKLMLT